MNIFLRSLLKALKGEGFCSLSFVSFTVNLPPFIKCDRPESSRKAENSSVPTKLQICLNQSNMSGRE